MCVVCRVQVVCMRDMTCEMQSAGHASIVSHSHADPQLLELLKCHLSFAQKDQRGLCLAML